MKIFGIKKETINSSNTELTGSIKKVLELLDKGEIRICEKKNNTWITNQWIKKASFLMSFRVNDNSIFQVVFQILEEGNTPGLIKLILKHLAGLKMNGQKEVLDPFQVQ